MGFNFRKSFNVGKFGKINLSKSGIGGSIGAKGVRVTRSATGKTQTRVTIPNTGISWTSSTKKKK